MKRLHWKALLRMEEIPVVFLLIQLGLGVWEKRGWPIPAPPVFHQRGRDLPGHRPGHALLHPHHGL